jgi:hypothetical protein
MAEVTYYVALPFVASDDGVAAGEPTECFNPDAAVMGVEALSRKEGHVGVVAFSPGRHRPQIMASATPCAGAVFVGKRKARRLGRGFVQCEN